MKTNKYAEELRAESAAELREALVPVKRELSNLRPQNATSQLGNTARISEVRKNTARTQTAITGQVRA